MNMSCPPPSLSLFHILPYTHVPVPVLEIYYILTVLFFLSLVNVRVCLHLPLSLPVPCPLCPPNWSSPFHNTQVSRIFPPVFLCLPSPHAWFCSWTAFSPKKIYRTIPSTLYVQRIARKALVTSALATPDVAPVFASVVPAKTLKKRRAPWILTGFQE